MADTSSFVSVGIFPSCPGAHGSEPDYANSFVCGPFTLDEAMRIYWRARTIKVEVSVSIDCYVGSPGLFRNYSISKTGYTKGRFINKNPVDPDASNEDSTYEPKIRVCANGWGYYDTDPSGDDNIWKNAVSFGSIPGAPQVYVDGSSPAQYYFNLQFRIEGIGLSYGPWVQLTPAFYSFNRMGSFTGTFFGKSITLYVGGEFNSSLSYSVTGSVNVSIDDDWNFV